MKEHKKLYKAGKNWLIATITIASVTLLGGMTAQNVNADPVRPSTTTVQTQSNQTNITQANESTQTVTSSNNANGQVASSNKTISQSDISTTTNNLTVSQPKANASNQWVHYDQGWSRTDTQGNWIYNQWENINNNWYHFDNAGYADTGWYQSGAGNWYYFDNQNAWALKNWQRINNHWYYFDPVNAWADTGWQKINNNWYYFDPTNAWAETGWQKINNRWYYFDNQNAWALTGWQKINNRWYYFDPVNAWADTGWFKSGAGNWFYFDWNNAWALTGWQKINNRWYYFDNQNAWALRGWQKINGSWYYFDPVNTWMDTGWTTVGNKSYELSGSGAWTGQTSNTTSSNNSSNNNSSSSNNSTTPRHVTIPSDENLIDNVDQLPLTEDHQIKYDIPDLTFTYHFIRHDYSEKVSNQTGFTTKQKAELNEIGLVWINDILTKNGLKPLTNSQQVFNDLVDHQVVNIDNWDTNSGMGQGIDQDILNFNDQQGRNGNYQIIGHQNTASLAGIGNEYDHYPTMLDALIGLHNQIYIYKDELIKKAKYAESMNNPHVIIHFDNNGIVQNHPAYELMSFIFTAEGNDTTPLANTGFVDSIRAAQA